MLDIGTDPEAFEAFYRRHVRMVTGFVARRVVDPHVVDDLTTEVFLAAIEGAGRYRPKLGGEAAWLVGIARNVLAAERRRSARQTAKDQRAGGRRALDLYSHPIDVPGDPNAMRLQINTRLMKPGQYFVFALTTSVDSTGFTGRGVGEYLVTGRLIKCRYEPVPRPTLPPPPESLREGKGKKVTAVGISSGYIRFGNY